MVAQHLKDTVFKNVEDRLWMVNQFLLGMLLPTCITFQYKLVSSLPITCNNNTCLLDFLVWHMPKNNPPCFRNYRFAFFTVLKE